MKIRRRDGKRKGIRISEKKDGKKDRVKERHSNDDEINLQHIRKE
jgi:hypothetical protein